MSVYDDILEKKKQDRIRYELEQRKEEIKELDKEIDRRRSINYDLSLQIIDKDKEIERLQHNQEVSTKWEIELTQKNTKLIEENKRLKSIIEEAKNETKKQLKRAVSQEYTDLGKILKILRRINERTI